MARTSNINVSLKKKMISFYTFVFFLVKKSEDIEIIGNHVFCVFMRMYEEDE